jgi:DNA-binding MarR family transcriptional regulator
MNIYSHDLTDFERKLVTIIQHNNKRGRSPSLKELEFRSGYTESEIKETINNLIKRNWLGVHEGKIIVKRILF